MNRKNEIIGCLQEAKYELIAVITMIENNDDCLKIHSRINKVVRALEITNKEILNNYLDEYLSNLFKDNIRGETVRNEIINFFQT